MQPNEWARRNIFPCHNILFSINDRRTSIYILRGRTRRKNYELLYERQQLSLDSYYPAHSRNVRKRILVTSVLRLRLARACRTCLLHVQKRYALLALRKRRLRLLQRLTPKFESDSVSHPKIIGTHSTIFDRRYKDFKIIARSRKQIISY